MEQARDVQSGEDIMLIVDTGLKNKSYDKQKIPWFVQIDPAD